MANDISIKATWGEKRTLEELSKAIQARTRELKGQTTENAVLATTLTVLKSLRAATMQLRRTFQIDEQKWNIAVAATGYTAGWAYPGKHNPKGKRVIRLGQTGSMDRDENGKRVVNLAGGYQGKAVEQTIRVYRLTIKNTHTNAPPFYDSLVISKSVDDVKKFAQRRINRRVQQYKGVSRRLIGLLMKKVYSGANPPSEGASQLPYLDNLAVVQKQGNGFSSGNFGISVEDNLVDAILAVKGGESGLNLALQKAANSTIGWINKMLEKSLGEKLPIPFPEITR